VLTKSETVLDDLVMKRNGTQKRIDYLAYVTRELPTSRQAGSRVLLEGPNPLHPAYHSFGNRALFNEAKENCLLVVWLFSRIKVGRKSLPLALDAKIVVHRSFERSKKLRYATKREIQLLRKRQYLFKADQKRSEYFPWKSGEDLFEGILRLFPNQKAKPEYFFRHGIKLPGEAVALLDEHAKKLSGCPRAFIGYKWAEGTPAALDVAECLDEQGVASWLDLWGMPRSVRELKTEMREKSLWRYIKTAASECRYRIVIRTAGSETGGAKRELSMLRKLQRQRPSIFIDLPGEWGSRSLALLRSDEVSTSHKSRIGLP